MAASVTRQVHSGNLAFEDYSVYGHLSDEELLQLAIERSLTETQGPSEPSAQAACSPLAQEQQETPQEERMPTFREVRREYAAMRQAAFQAQRAALTDDCAEADGSSRSHTFDGDRERLLAWRRRNKSKEVTVQSADDVPRLNSAIWKNDVKTVSEILTTEPPESLNKPNKEGWIHLHEAAYSGSVDCLKVLVEAFPELINKRNEKNQTPLILAVGRKHLNCVQVLLAAGGDPNIANRAGETAVYKACEKGTEEIVDAVLKSGGHPSRPSVEGVTPLHEAVAHKNVNMCKMLVDAGAKIYSANKYGIEPLFTAAQSGATDALNLFLKLGGNFNTQADDGATPLYEASKNGHEEVVKILLSKRADVHKATNAGLTPLHIASKNGHISVVLLLLPRTNKRIVTRSGISPLHLAAERNRDEILEILIEAGYDVNFQLSPDHSKMYEDRRSTVLYFSVRGSNLDAASMLLEAGADPNLDVFNPLLVAVRKGNIEMASLLVEHGANVNACMPTHPTTFPASLLFCMKQKSMFKMLLDNGLDAAACFNCVFGSNSHPPVKINRPTRDDLYLHGLEAPHTSTAQFCEVMADPINSPWVGMILDRLLDYVGHVKLCSRLINLLDNTKDGEYIREKAKPPLSLVHLCRLRIRKQVGQRRLRQMTTLPLPDRLIKYLFYDNTESEEFLSYCGCF